MQVAFVLTLAVYEVANGYAPVSLSLYFYGSLSRVWFVAAGMVPGSRRTSPRARYWRRVRGLCLREGRLQAFSRPDADPREALPTGGSLA